MNIEFSKPFKTAFDWWKRNVRDDRNRIDTSRGMKLAVMCLVIIFCIFAGVVYIIEGIQFFQQWIADTKTYKLMLSDETNKNLAVIVGIIAGSVKIDYRVAQWLRGKNGK